MMSLLLVVGVQEHEHRAQLTPSRWEAFREGDPIDIVYSRRRPHVSAPRWLVDETRKAVAKR